LIFSLIGLRHLRVLRFAPADAGPATVGKANFPFVPVAVNSTTLGSLVRSRRPIMTLFPKLVAPIFFEGSPNLRDALSEHLLSKLF
jgi:hypothetical protein